MKIRNENGLQFLESYNITVEDFHTLNTNILRQVPSYNGSFSTGKETFNLLVDHRLSDKVSILIKYINFTMRRPPPSPLDVETLFQNG